MKALLSTSLLASCLVSCLNLTMVQDSTEVADAYSQLGTLRGRVYPADDPDLRWSGGRFRFYRDSLRTCGFSTLIGGEDEARYDARLAAGTWRVVYIEGDTQTYFDILSPGQPREVTVEAGGEHEFDIVVQSEDWGPPSVEDVELYEEGISLRGAVSARRGGETVRLSSGSFLLQRVDYPICAFEVPIIDSEGYRVSVVPGRYRILAYEVTLDGELIDLLAPGQPREVDVVYSPSRVERFNIEMIDSE